MIVRVDAQRKGGVGGGIFMAAIDDGVVIKGHQLAKTVPHHRRITLEQPSTSHGEQRVAGEGKLFRFKVEIQHVQRMARRGENVDLPAGEGKSVTAGKGGGNARNTDRPVSGRAGFSGDIQQAGSMVAMMVLDPDLCELPAGFAQRGPGSGHVDGLRFINRFRICVFFEVSEKFAVFRHKPFFRNFIPPSALLSSETLPKQHFQYIVLQS